MKPERESKKLLAVTRSKAKMYEYNVPETDHIVIPKNPAELFTLTIGILGEVSGKINRGGINTSDIEELKQSLQFSSSFFDAYISSKLNSQLDQYVLLMGAAAYYLCDLPGSSSVLTRNILIENCNQLETDGLERLLYWFLQGNFSEPMPEEISSAVYREYIYDISNKFMEFKRVGSDRNILFASLDSLRHFTYENGTPRQLLFADIICALARKRHEYSTWRCLPYYSDIPAELWQPVIRKSEFMSELWPAQQLLGEKGVYKGISAIVQMPTSAGKTRATELIIRSAFLSARTSLAVIIAPFKALCNEIRNSLMDSFTGEEVKIDELSEVLQRDFNFTNFLGHKQILVVTPEKFNYVLRQSPDIASAVGLVIYDEGHLFDDNSRGVTYELLLASLKAMLPSNEQTILISAVINNCEGVNKWLNGESGTIVTGTNLIPTYRTVAFTSWLDRLGRLEFVNQQNPEQSELFVPRILEQQTLLSLERERTQRIFPKKDDGKEIALYLGLKLINNGCVAIFCGTKDSATSLCNIAIDKYNRNLTIPSPLNVSDREEIRKLHFLYEKNLGENQSTTKSAKLGIFTHHGTIPHGIRLAVEHALHEGLVKFIICTSTLAQGVNLPIRYLIVTSIKQSKKDIKTRDFHNLLGRVGRSGMHTEGSIIFADPNIYDQKSYLEESWRWAKIKELLNPLNSEPCTSTIALLFREIYSENEKFSIPMEPLDLVRFYINNSDEFSSLPDEIASRHIDKNFTASGVRQQIESKINIISAIESYLMAHWNETSGIINESNIEQLIQNTLAYSLSDDDQKQLLKTLFIMIKDHIIQSIPDASKRKCFGKTLFGVKKCLDIETWVNQNIGNMLQYTSQTELLINLWDLLAVHIKNNKFKNCNPQSKLIEIATGWISGEPYYNLYEYLKTSRIGTGSRPRKPTMENLVEICDNALGYEGTMIIGAVIEVTKMLSPENQILIDDLNKLQKSLKYGLPSMTSVAVYEAGFSDKVISLEISTILSGSATNRFSVINEIRRNEAVIRSIVNQYPSYYSERLNALLREGSV